MEEAQAAKGQQHARAKMAMTAAIISTGMLIPDGWQPPAALTTRGPRHETHCFGYWYLP